MVKRIIILLFVFSSILSFGQANRFAGFGCTTCNCDVDAKRFIDSVPITDTMKQRVICTLVKQLKDSSLWNTYYAIYPYIDTTAKASKYNLVNPSLYTSSFTGGCTFSSSGVLFNGTDAYQNTGVNPFSIMTKGNISYSILINGGTLSGSPYPTTMGATVTNGTDDVLLAIQSSSKFFIPSGQSYNIAILSNTSTTGFFCGTVKSGSINLLKDGNVLATNTESASGSLSNAYIYIGALGGTLSTITYQNVRAGIVLIGQGKTPAQAQTEWNIVNQFKTTLGR